VTDGSDFFGTRLLLRGGPLPTPGRLGAGLPGRKLATDKPINGVTMGKEGRKGKVGRVGWKRGGAGNGTPNGLGPSEGKAEAKGWREITRGVPETTLPVRVVTTAERGRGAAEATGRAIGRPGKGREVAEGTYVVTPGLFSGWRKREEVGLAAAIGLEAKGRVRERAAIGFAGMGANPLRSWIRFCRCVRPKS